MDLKKIATLGAGAFGQVFLVKHSSQYYALKCLSKAQVIETGLQVSIVHWDAMFMVPSLTPGSICTPLTPLCHSYDQIRRVVTSRA